MEQGRPDDFEEERIIIDEEFWRSNCLDLQRAMDVAKSMFLLLEHSNEAAARVGLEIAACRLSKRCLWWDESWFADEHRYDYFKELVREKLDVVLGAAKRWQPSELFRRPPDPGGPRDAESPELVEMRRRAEQAEAAAQMAETRCQDLRAAAQESQERSAALEQSVEQMRRKVREAEGSAATAAATAAAAQAAAAAAAAAPAPIDSSKRVSQAESRPAQGAPDANAAGGGQTGLSEDAARRFSALERELKQAEQAKAQMQQRLQEAEQKAVRAEARAASTKKTSRAGSAGEDGEDDGSAVNRSGSHNSGSDQSRLNDALAKLEVERQRIKELEKAAKLTEAALTKVQEEAAAAEKKASVAEQATENLQSRLKAADTALREAKEAASSDAKKANAPSVQPVTEPAPPPVAKKKPKDDGNEHEAEMEELRRKLESMKERMRNKDADIAALNEDKAKLEDLKTRMSRALTQVKEQLHKVTSIAERKGCGALVAEIMNEAQVSSTINSKEFTCFSRLWQDAIRRQKKALKQGEESHTQTGFLRRRKSVIEAEGADQSDAVQAKDIGDQQGEECSLAVVDGERRSTSFGLDEDLQRPDSRESEGRSISQRSRSHANGSFEAGYRMGYEAAQREAGGDHRDFVSRPVSSAYGQAAAKKCARPRVAPQSFMLLHGRGLPRPQTSNEYITPSRMPSPLPPDRSESRSRGVEDHCRPSSRRLRPSSPARIEIGDSLREEVLRPLSQQRSCMQGSFLSSAYAVRPAFSSASRSMDESPPLSAPLFKCASYSQLLTSSSRQFDRPPLSLRREPPDATMLAVPSTTTLAVPVATSFGRARAGRYLINAGPSELPNLKSETLNSSSGQLGVRSPSLGVLGVVGRGAGA